MDETSRDNVDRVCGNVDDMHNVDDAVFVG